MTTTVELINAARATIGTRETGTNRQPFAAEIGHANGYAWCQTWANAMAKRAGVTLPDGVMETAYTPSAVNAFKKAGRWHVDPQPGDFVYFQFDKDPQVDHVGIVVAVHDNGTITTIEGNTSADHKGSQSHGGGVYERVRSRSVCVGFGRPLFKPAHGKPAVSSGLAPINEETLMAIVFRDPRTKQVFVVEGGKKFHLDRPALTALQKMGATKGEPVESKELADLFPTA